MSGFVGLLTSKRFKQDSKPTQEENVTVLKNEEMHDEMESMEQADFLVMKRTDYRNVRPFIFDNERYGLVFDGTIYNKGDLRKKLEKKGYKFNLDTTEEVLSNLFLECGVKRFQLLRGTFAIVIWDYQEKILYAARDPFGIKPLYMMETEEEVLFSTEIQAITRLGKDLTFHYQALQHYFSFQYIPPPLTLKKEITSLKPGHYLIKKAYQPLETYAYFKAAFHPVNGNENQIINRIQEILVDSVKVHIQEEKSLGALLSGGIDSSLLVGIAKQFNPSIKTFTVGFDVEGYSEIPIAQQTADELGVENISYLISPAEFVASLPTIIHQLEEPLADPSCVPLYFAAKKASNHTKIVLSGEGADELFGGYNIYHEFHSLNVFQYLPDTVRKWLRTLSRIVPEGIIGRSFLERGTTPLHERYIGNAKIFEEDEKRRFMKTYDELITYKHMTADLFAMVKEAHPAHQMQYVDMHTWLPGDILRKADRMTKAHSIELRTPFLDKEVFDVASKIPVAYKITNKQTKAILRKAAIGFIPEHVTNRKKLGFPVPLKSWLRNELYDWATEIIQESNTDHILDKTYCMKLLKSHYKGYNNNARKLWTILVFMMWHQLFMES
ncbi:asparagine synthase (glutamine-hydrolyzing) [Ornithinibacillus sp. FSL M8-0202]|uniref:asparagine synthase (glutamine-hydrolyzing) n=1 Tax=Ornithinibacillus sp. FSL M8-0202 TaxID=2921616 RepID=UPI0030CBE92F